MMSHMGCDTMNIVVG